MFKNITLIGMPGSGKSYVGRKLADRLRYTFLDLDRTMEARFAKALPTILKELGDNGFLEQQGTEAILYTDAGANFVIAPGGSIVYSEDAMQHLKSISNVIYLKADLETIRERIGDTPRGIVGLQNRSLEELYEERVPLYEEWADVEIDGERNADDIVTDIETLLKATP